MSEHVEPHLEDGLCQCDCSGCVDDWRPMKYGGARRHCICPDCVGGDCPNWRLDLELWRTCGGSLTASG